MKRSGTPGFECHANHQPASRAKEKTRCGINRRYSERFVSFALSPVPRARDCDPTNSWGSRPRLYASACSAGSSRSCWNEYFSAEVRAQHLVVTEDSLIVDLSDGRSITVQLAWYPRLQHAYPKKETTRGGLATAREFIGRSRTKISA